VTNSELKKSDKIYIAGHRSLVGSAIIRQLEARGFTNLPSTKEAGDCNRMYVKIQSI
jgi:nucleoside-diphosphate-sugar epimerase